MEDPELPPAAWTVLKFGGSSVADPAHWPTIERAVRDVIARGERPILVCSALAGVSDDLEQLLAELDNGGSGEERIARLRRRHEKLAAALEVDADQLLEGCRRELDELLLSAHHLPRLPAALRAQIMALGELMSTKLGAAWLRKRGLSAEWRDARELLVARPPLPGASAQQQYLSASCPYDSDRTLQRQLEGIRAEVVVTQGFIARNSEGFTVLLGRGGSDTAAAVLAAKLQAKGLEIWSDVPGIFSANPHRIPDARLLEELSYEEAETLAALGARVLHRGSLEPVRTAGIPLQLRWTHDASVRGTRIGAVETDPGFCGISSRHHLCLITVERSTGAAVGFLAGVASCFQEEALSMELVASSPTRIRTVIDLSRAPGIVDRLPSLTKSLGDYGRARIDRAIASVSLVGRDLKSRLPRIARWVASLEDDELLMIDQAANDLSFTMLVPAERADSILERAHADVFEEGDLCADRFGPTWRELNNRQSRQLQAAS